MKSGGLLSTGTGTDFGNGIEFAFKRGTADEVGFGSLLDLGTNNYIKYILIFFFVYTVGGVH